MLLKQAVFLFLIAIGINFGTSPHSMSEEPLVRVVAEVKKSVVFLQTDKGSGTGFIVNDRMIVTNWHVIENAAHVFIKFNGDVYTPAEGLLFVDADRDIAVLAVKTRKELMIPVGLHDSIPQQGQTVLAFGNPKGLECSTSMGIVSATRDAEFMRRIFKEIAPSIDATWIQTDAAISPGNSGGPLVSIDGNVVGMNSFYLGGVDSQNLNFAISSIEIKTALATANASPLIKIGPAKSANESPDVPLQSASSGTSRELAEQKFVEFRASVASRVSTALKSASIYAQPIASSVDPYQAMQECFPVGKIADATFEDVVRIKTNATMIQIQEDGFLYNIDGAICKLVRMDLNAAELQAKMGVDPIHGVAIEGVFFVGKSFPYQSAGGKKLYFMTLVPLYEIFSREELTTMHNEYALVSVGRQLRGIFKDSTGRFEVDAVAVNVNETHVQLFRLDKMTAVSLELSNLGKSEQAWVRREKATIQRFGKLILEKMLPAANE